MFCNRNIRNKNHKHAAPHHQQEEDPELYEEDDAWACRVAKQSWESSVVVCFAPKQKKERKKETWVCFSGDFLSLGPYYSRPFWEYFLFFRGFWKANPRKGNKVKKGTCRWDFWGFLFCKSKNKVPLKDWCVCSHVCVWVR